MHDFPLSILKNQQFNKLYKFYKMGNSNPYTQDIEKALKRRNQSIQKLLPRLRQISATLQPTQIQSLLRQDVPQLVKALNSRTINSQQLVAIYAVRAGTIGREICAITEDYFQYALIRSAECDSIRAKSGKKNWTLEENVPYEPSQFLPPLFGIPISLKDNIELEGTTSTIGLAARANRIIKKDGLLAQAIKRAGMIPFVKTNLPQIAMNFDSCNEIWGRTLNPWNKNKSAGGSSGGESAAIASRMSPLGVGNDIGGSLRVPAAYCGITSLLSGQGRLPHIGSYTFYSEGFAGMDLIKVVTGPMSTSIDGLALWMGAMTHPQAYGVNDDPYIRVHPFNLPLYKQLSNERRPLKIGFIQNLEIIECTPAYLRGLKQTVNFLRSQGHQLVKIALPRERETVFTFYREVAGEGNLQSYKQLLEGQPLIKEYSSLEEVTNMNCCMMKCLKTVAGLSQPRMEMLLEASEKLSTHQYILNKGRTHVIREQWIDYWKGLGLDFIVTPGYGSEATNHGMSNIAFLLAAYTMIWNVLAMSSCSLPVTVVKSEEQFYESYWQDDLTDAIKETVKDSAGLPVNIQVISLPHREERLLGFAKKIEAHFQFYKKHPLPDL